MRISVAMCTFNGESLVRDELQGFLAQTRLPDELVVCDDGSTDATVAIIEEFARDAPFTVRLHVNEANLRYTKNLEQVIGLCSGDLIVLADWDDVWLPTKLERMEQAAVASEDVGLIYSDAEVVDTRLRPMGVSLWEARGFGRTKQSHVAAGRNEWLLRGHVNWTYGTTMALNARYRPAVLPIPEEWHAEDTRVGQSADTWIAVVVAGMARIALIPEPLVRYRQHGSNESGVGRRDLMGRFRTAQANDVETFLARADRLQLAIDRLGSMTDVDPNFLEHLRRMRQHNVGRARIARSRGARLPLVVTELLKGRYTSYSNGWRSAAADLLRPAPKETLPPSQNPETRE
ncbi:MAG: glycosyltransferase family 2 protein [Actinomycetota bacterium]|nr:glycosyltransferase family 2 protein [Actinomycetota bacterium]